jgi:O-acetyl-ADP-ribose deacetylase
MKGDIVLERGDITRAATDAIVNAANTHLAPGGGVSGAIHSAGGPQIAAECRAIVSERGPLETGGAAATSGGRLAARYVIHAVGPVWHGGSQDEAAALGRAYLSAIEEADRLGLCSVAFPSISTGIYGYPVGLAAPVALRAVREGLDSAKHVHEARFVLYDEPTYEVYERALGGSTGRPGK